MTDWTDIPCPDNPNHRTYVKYSSEVYPNKDGKKLLHWRLDLNCNEWHMMGGDWNSGAYLKTIAILDQRTGPHIIDGECWCWEPEIRSEFLRAPREDHGE